MKFLLITLCLLMSNTVFAHDFEAVNDDGVTIYYNITSNEDKTVGVTYMGDDYYSPAYSGRVVIPETVEYQGVIYSVTSIGECAFYECADLTSIEITNSVTSIGRGAFDRCLGLTSVDIPNGVKTINNATFFECKNLKHVTIPNSVTSILYQAFQDCFSLETLFIPKSVQEIAWSAFYRCKGLKTIQVESGNTVYDSRNNCNALIEGTTLLIGSDSSFIPDGITTISSRAFYGHTAITNMNIPNSVTSIGEEAFSGCSGLTSVDIPGSVTSIYESAFAGCSGLTSVDIPNSVKTLGSGAFGRCTGLTSVTIGNNVRRIPNSAFSSCSSLTSIDIPNSVTSIGQYAFYGCTSLASIHIPNSVTSIDLAAFLRCSALTSIDIPNSVISIGTAVFNGCNSLTSITVATDNTKYDSRDNCNAIIETSTNTLIAGCHTTVIPNSVTSIGEDAFECSSLTSIDIPNSVTSIDRYAFNGCSGLTSIVIPNSVTSIGTYAFGSCSSLTSIHWTPNSETDISSTLSETSLPSTSRTLYLYVDVTNKDMVKSIMTTLEGKFKEIILVEDLERFDLDIAGIGMSTLYLDYPVKVPDNDDLLATMYVSRIEGNVMWMKKVKDYIPANTGVIVQGNPTTITFRGTMLEMEGISDNQLQGVVEDTPVTDISGTVYTLGRGVDSGYIGFSRYTGSELPANKAFLVLDGASDVNSFRLVLDNEDGTSTSIGRIENGELIPENEDVYDLQGRRVEHPSKGIYIVNGKKQYIK